MIGVSDTGYNNTCKNSPTGLLQMFLICQCFLQKNNNNNKKSNPYYPSI